VLKNFTSVNDSMYWTVVLPTLRQALEIDRNRCAELLVGQSVTDGKHVMSFQEQILQVDVYGYVEYFPIKYHMILIKMVNYLIMKEMMNCISNSHILRDLMTSTLETGGEIKPLRKNNKF
jgi:hypothetical protein